MNKSDKYNANDSIAKSLGKIRRTYPASKNTDRKNTEKDLAKLIEEINKKDFKSKGELNNFMSSLMG